MLTNSNLENAALTNHALTHATKQTPKRKNHRILKKFQLSYKKKVTRSPCVLNGKPLKIVELIFNPINNTMHNLNLPQRRYLIIFLKNQILSNKRAPKTYVSPQKSYNHSSPQPRFRNQTFTPRQRDFS